jgi:hypothetical protein
MLLAAGVPVSASFLKADAGSISAAAFLGGMIGLSGFVLLKSTRNYRRLVFLSGEEADRWDRFNRPTRLLDFPDEESKE